MDHRALVADRHAAAHRERARQKLNNQCLHFEYVLDAGAVEEANDLGDAGAGRGRLVQHQQAAAHEEDEAVADRVDVGTVKVALLDKVLCEVPLALGYDVDDLVEEEAENAD